MLSGSTYTTWQFTVLVFLVHMQKLLKHVGN
jgi:hypothetical protein